MILFAFVYFLILSISFYLTIIADGDESLIGHLFCVVFSFIISILLTLIIKSTGMDDITLVKYIYGFVVGTLIIYNIFLRIRRLPF